jgi:hypothetical protein
MSKVFITKDGKFRAVSKKNAERILKHPQSKGWTAVTSNASMPERKVFEETKAAVIISQPESKTPKQEVEQVVEEVKVDIENTLPSALTKEQRDVMISALKEKGINVHWNLSDDKLQLLYDSEIKNS